MASPAIAVLRKLGARVEHKTVPGIKDLAVECKRLLDGGCDAALALGWVGGAPIDEVCANQASMGIQWAKLLTNKHIVEATIHEIESDDPKELAEMAVDRAAKHAKNAYILAKDGDDLSKHAGQGLRQGKDHVGSIKVKRK
jgi:riboflavin synthase